jgi:hypothetical protein
MPSHPTGLTIDTGGGRLVSIAIWESQEAAEATTSTVRAEMVRRILPELTGPPEVTHAGTVISQDITGR